MWLLVYISSLLVLMGGQKASLLYIGLTLLLIAFGVAGYLAIGPEPGRPGPRGYARRRACGGSRASWSGRFQ